MDIVGIAVLTALAAVVGTIAGFGVSTIMVPVLVLLLPVPQTLLLVGAIHWFVDIWKIVLFRQGVDWPFVLRFGIPAVAMSYLGARLAVDAPEALLSRLLGGALVAYILFLLARPAFRLARSAGTVMAAGAASGFLPGIFGLGGQVRSAFLAAFDLPKGAFIFTNGVLAIFIDTTRLGTYVASGVRLDSRELFGLLVFIPASFAGAKIAQRFAKGIPQKRFRPVVALLLLVVGIKLLFT